LLEILRCAQDDKEAEGKAKKQKNNKEAEGKAKKQKA
jgi:hypothetical protein